ncbi:unnamed protein product (macronuclear) [Paramecium tetraurelia]|uniref:Cullin neddylation domain-containing protein n=1 Tax=Paramecium tetraurelia TaxID=5888 RepID=A0DNQ6_PARTE|nr:uncharacterized protein GSPATT00018869001 [Paramecium tetraurelia]CAK84673.1 unnamed protein product [Paramecium tetraurelia]|eukprot:XP_001452070.1 hypothetical protein (macronuclear) [Paramecium tetraurelia strain d4-2]
MYKGPNNLKTYKVSDCEPLLKDFFNSEDCSNLSIRQCGIAIRHNLQQLISIISKLLSVRNIVAVKQRLYWLNKITSIDITECLILGIKSSSQKIELLKFILNNLKDRDFQQVAAYYHDDIDYTTYIDYATLLKDGNILLQIQRNEQQNKFFEKLQQQLQKFINKDIQLDESLLIELLHLLQINMDTAQAIISKYVWMNIQDYDKLDYFVNSAIKLQQLQYVSVIQNQVESQLKDKQLIYSIAKEIQSKDTIHQFVQKFMISKLNQSQLFQQYQLQMAVSKYIMTNQKPNAYFQTLDFIASIQYFNEILVVSNYFWNKGEVQQNIVSPLKDITLPITKQIEQQFKSIPVQTHKIFQLFQIVLQVQYKNTILFVTLQELALLQQFQKVNQAKINNIEWAQRLITIGVFKKINSNELQICEENFNLLQNFEFAQKPEVKKQEILIEEYEQNKKLIIEAGIMKIMKQEKKMQQQTLYGKLAQLIKRSVILTEIELIESIKGLVKRDLLCYENDVVFYSI